MSQDANSFELLSDSEPYQQGWEGYYRDQQGNTAWGDQPPPFLPPILAEHLIDGSSVVDFGAGEGRNSLMLGKQGYRLTLVDISPAGLQLANSRARHLKVPTPTLVVGDLEHLPLVDGQFDFAICIDALPQVPRPRPALAEMARTLVPGGTLVTNVFTPRDAAYGEGEQLNARAFVFKGTLFTFFEDDEFRPLIDGLFEVVECQKVRWDDPPHKPFRPYPHTHEALVYVLRKP